jgi:hypothetical protein
VVDDVLVVVGDLRWSITHTSFSQEEKEMKLSKARERQWRAYSLPPGVSLEEMEEIWNQLDFGGRRRRPEEDSEAPSGDGESDPSSTTRVEERESTFDPSYFSLPSKNVKLLRNLSIRGKADMELMLEQTRGRPKLIWGEPEAYVDQVGSDESVTEDELMEASEMVGDPLVKCEGAVPVDVNEVTTSVADYT